MYNGKYNGKCFPLTHNTGTNTQLADSIVIVAINEKEILKVYEKLWKIII